MFGRIVPRYDLMNRLMTGAQDLRWRRWAAAAARPSGGIALDLATGTADLAIELRSLGARRVYAIDFCPPMLESAAWKIRRRRIDGVDLVLADAQELPFPDASFDCVASAFLLRNVADLPRCLSEMRRVLRPGGRAVALDLTRVSPGPIGLSAQTYLRHFVPWLGRLVTGDARAYQYLPASVQPFPDAERLADLFRQAGFDDVGYRRLGFGCVAMHVAALSRQPSAVSRQLIADSPGAPNRAPSSG